MRVLTNVLFNEFECLNVGGVFGHRSWCVPRCTSAPFLNQALVCCVIYTNGAEKAEGELARKKVEFEFPTKSEEE